MEKFQIDAREFQSFPEGNDIELITFHISLINIVQRFRRRVDVDERTFNSVRFLLRRKDLRILYDLK